MKFSSKAEEENTMMRLLTHKLMIEDQFMSFEDEHISCLPNVPQIDTALMASNTGNGNLGPAITVDAGVLGVIPLEIVVEILNRVDLKALLKLRQTCRFMKHTIDQTMIHYRNLIKCAPGALVAIHRTGMAAHVSTRQLSLVLYSPICWICKKEAPLLNMISVTRCCYVCLTKDPRLDPITRHTAKYKYGLDGKTMKALPMMKSIPGTFSYFQNIYKRRINLMDEELAFIAGIERAGGLQALKDAMGPDIYAQWPYGPEQRKHVGHPRRFMTAVPFPTFDLKSQVLDWFVCCIGCSCYITNRHYFLTNHTAFSKRGFLEHFQHCQEAQNIWATYVAKKRALPAGYTIQA